jgi:hypothetical protein
MTTEWLTDLVSDAIETRDAYASKKNNGKSQEMRDVCFSSSLYFWLQENSVEQGQQLGKTFS